MADDKKKKDLDEFADVSNEEMAILERLEDADDLTRHCHHALVHNPFAWTA